MYSLFQDWQSPKTKGSKKFLFTIIFLLSFGFFSGLNLIELELFGVDTSELDPMALIVTLFFVLVISGLYYFFHNKRDDQVNKARLKTIRGELQECLEYTKKLHVYASKSEKVSVEELIRQRISSEKLLSKDSPLNVYHSINHYREELKEPARANQILPKFENVGITFLTCTSLIFILDNAYKIYNDEPIDTFILYFILSVCLFAAFFHQFTK